MIKPGGFEVRLRVHGGLTYFLKSGDAGGEITRYLSEPTSVKDVIESCGVPHPEVDGILIDDAPVEFNYVLRENRRIAVYPVEFNETGGGEVRSLQTHHAERFVADGHLGKLVRNLRLLGFDTAYDSQPDDRELLEIMEKEKRALLTRDRRLLMHSVVRDGYCPRSDDPLTQTVEVIRRLSLINSAKPFTRCLRCNGALREVDKPAVLDQLEPLTRIYYHEFRTCTECGKIFWRGSHFSKLESFLERIRSELHPP